MKKYYYSPEAEIILFDTDDVIDDSFDYVIDDGEGDGWDSVGDSKD